MIDLYSGTPGSGKSLHTAMRLYYWLRAGKTCICNFDIDLTKVRRRRPDLLPFFEIENREITPEFLIEFSKMHFAGKRVKEDSIVLVIDEAQILFNARTWQQTGRNEWLSFFSQHRKYGYHIILIAQFDRMLDRQIRSVIEYEYVHRKVSNFGLKGKILSLAMGAKVFVAVKVWYPMNEKVGQEFFRAKRRYYSLYDSYGTFAQKTSGSGD